MKILSGFKLKYIEDGLLNMSTINYINNTDFNSWQEKINFVRMLLALSEMGVYFKLSELVESKNNPSIFAHRFPKGDFMVIEKDYSKELMEHVGFNPNYWELENKYSKKEYNQLLQLKNDWNDIPLNYNDVVDAIIDINLFIKNYSVLFPESKNMIQENELLLDSLNSSLAIFNKVFKKQTLVENEFQETLDRIDEGFQSLLFDLLYKD